MVIPQQDHPEGFIYGTISNGPKGKCSDMTINEKGAGGGPLCQINSLRVCPKVCPRGIIMENVEQSLIDEKL